MEHAGLEWFKINEHGIDDKLVGLAFPSQPAFETQELLKSCKRLEMF